MKKFVYTSLTRSDVLKRAAVSKFVVEQGCTPINLAINVEYFPSQDTDKMVQRADEIWVFGVIDKKMWSDIMLAKKLRKPVRYFIFEDGGIREIQEQNARYDEEVREIIIEEKVRSKVIPQIRFD